MASTTNAFGLLLDDGDLQPATGKKRNKKKKSKAPSTQPADVPVQKPPPVPEAKKAPEPREEAEDRQDGFQTVVKSSKGKNLAAAKSVDNLPGASLAADARQAAEALAESPAIQDTIETWTRKMQREKSPSYLDEGGKLLSWKEVLLSSSALETLVATCLSERVDASLQPQLAAIFLDAASGRGLEARRLADVLATGVVRLAGSLESSAGPDREAALALLRRLLALLRAPPQPAARRQALQPPAPISDLEAQLVQQSSVLRASKAARQVELWHEIQGLLDRGLSGNAPASHGPELPAAAALREYEEALQQLRKDPAAQKQAAKAEAERLAGVKASLESKLKEAQSLVESLQAQLTIVEQDIIQHQTRTEQRHARVSAAAVQKQLEAAAELKDALGYQEPPQAPTGPQSITPRAHAAVLEAASSLLVSQLKQQREIALKGKHAQDRLARKQQQVQQLAGLGESKEHKTAAGQLDALVQEVQKYQRDSAKLCEFADRVVVVIQQGAGGQHAAAEALEISRACHQQHAKILEGPLRLAAPWLESLVQDTRGALIGNPVPTASLPSPIARPQPAPVPPQAAGSPLASPAHPQAPTSAPAFNQWTAAGSPSQPAWGVHQPASFGELLQGSSVSQAPSKVPAPIAPASLGFGGAVEAPRGPMPSLLPSGGPPIGTTSPAAPLPVNGLPAELPLPDHSPNGTAAGLPGADGSKPKRNRSRKPRAPGP